jgi:hypothetical protein
MELVETSTPTESTTTDAATDDSIASHEAQFGTTPTPPLADPAAEKPGRERHRAKSQRASAEDVPRIAELTKNWRAEQERVKSLEAKIAEYEAKHAAPAKVETKTDATAFDQPEPTLEQFSTHDDPYTAYTRALARWDRAKEQFDAKRADAETARTKAAADADAKRDAAYVSRLQTFVAKTPDFAEKFAAVERETGGQLPMLLIQAIKEDDNGPALLYHLLTHPSDLDDMRFLSDGKPITETSVALLRRRLASLSRSQAVDTGSAVATAYPTLAPRPPKPVRTGPMKAGDDLPGEGASIADHARAFGPKPRQR